MDIWKFLAGLGIFLFGMQLLEQGLNQLAGRPFKRIIRRGTTNIFSAILMGIFATALLQSSSVVMLIVLAMVGARILHLRHALGVMLGSNLGTTMTGWVVATLGFKIDVEGLALPIVALGTLLITYLSRAERLALFGRVAAGFGLLFLGLSYMKVSTLHFAENLPVEMLKGHSLYFYFLIGFAITALIQSSSAMMVITLTALHSNLIDLTAAAAVVVGADLGTTMTAILGASRGSSEKRRVALAHFLFNLITDLIAFLALIPLLSFIQRLSNIEDPLYLLVLFHSSFNLLGIFIFVPFLGPFANFLNARFRQVETHLFKSLEKELTQSPGAGFVALVRQTKIFLQQILTLNQEVMGLVKNGDRFFAFTKATYLEKYEQLKRAEGEILEFATRLQTANLELAQATGIQHACQSVREGIQSAKAIKDIRHNLAEIRDSSDDLSFEFYQIILREAASYYQKLSALLEATPKANSKIFDELREELTQRFSRRLRHIQSASKDLDDLRTSNLLNLNREIYLSEKSLLLAIEELNQDKPVYQK